VRNEEQVDLSDAFNKDNDKKEGWGAIKYYQDPNAPKIIQYTVKYSGGLVNEKQASYVLLGFMVIIVAITIFLFSNMNSESPRDLEYKPDTIYGGKDISDDAW